ncbi:uracil-DNA glycosylase [Candidatus Saccharibacteria bacterium]|nr:uracil-DNA glycosylase [Candidatus Saccharibacteria bacterium]
MDESWKEFLNSEFSKPYFKSLSNFLHAEYENKVIFPKKTQVFRAFTTDLNKVTVVILGQDPYHTPGAAHGLAFSVPDNQPIPPSLINIYKEIDNDIGRHVNKTGNLSHWQEQGVLLLNNTLTVEAHKAGSHRGKGWETFTEAVIKYLNEKRPHLVFLLWGRDARSKAGLIDKSKHLVLESPHPSPLSAHYGFFGNHHFSKTNDFLKKNGLPEIEW